MPPIDPLPPKMLFTPCDTGAFDFTTTAELEPLDGIIGQERALAAVRFGIGMRREGYNLYVLGPPGTGKQTAVRHYLEQQAADAARPDDWCYINRFDDPQRPRALRLPAGRGRELRDDLARLVGELLEVINASFEGEAYLEAVGAIEDRLKKRQEAAFKELHEAAQGHDLALVKSPTGFQFAATREGEVLTQEQLEELPDDERQALTEAGAALQERLDALMRQVTGWRRKTQAQLRKLGEEMTSNTTALLTGDLRGRYVDLPDVLAHLDDLEADVLRRVDLFRRQDEQGTSPVQGDAEGVSPGRRYEVNLLVDNGGCTECAPVVFEDYPTYPNLIGRIEHVARMGTLSTDFAQIRPGALHRANGGYLVIDAMKMLAKPFAWEGLKRALRAGQVVMEPRDQALGVLSTATLEPEPIPLDVKVVLVGDRNLYYTLSASDPDFGELFKVAADFEDCVERTPANDLLYARLIGTVARKEGLRHFDRAAVARVIERMARLAEDAERLSAHMRSLADLLREADYWAGESRRRRVAATHVQKAVDAQAYRDGRVRDRVQEAIRRGTVLINTDGGRVGQINGLSVMQLGATAFGQPSRITATARLGEGEVVDIEREVDLGGSIHSKGVLILSSYLAARYAVELPLSLHATLVFEQSYGGVDGDSASVAELCALLSVLANKPIRQSLAVTGSIDQHGVVQAIGGANEKIEGFFDLCVARGLTGDQGVIIPAANVPHLMLRSDVVKAVRKRNFNVYAVRSTDQAVTLLTGIEAGARNTDGNFPEGTLNAYVEARLKEFSELRRNFSERPPGNGNGTS